MRRQLLAGLGMVLVFTVLTGLAYPLAITGIAQAIFPDQSNGSLVERDGRVVGSRLVAQPFTQPEYFHPRPSVVDYDATDSGGANWGPTNPDLLASVEANAQAYRENNGLAADDQVPVDAVTMSSSGLDPHISIANAHIQAERVADARGLPVEDVLQLIDENTDQRTFGFLGEPGVNVLELNLALDNL
jgi:K+-transporting ATPase ATPase C chain